MKLFVKLFRRISPKSPETVNDRTDLKRKRLMEESTSSNSTQSIDKNSESSTSCSSADFKAFENQIETLKAVVDNLKEEIEKKEISIAKLAREKEKISLDLSKQRRCNSNIQKQLEDERKFYFQEKEIFCHEMNEMKALKENISSANNDSNSINNLKRELENAKEKLEQTLEANYNLSIKFLRIKNTKSCLKNELGKIKMEHEKIFNDFKTKIEMMESEVTDIVENKSHLYASPSNRKYVQLVRQNSSLVHENLCLQMEIERLNSLFDRMRLRYSKSETNNRFKYIHSLKTEIHSNCKDEKKEKREVRIATEDKAITVNEESDLLKKSDLKNIKCQSPVIEIFDSIGSADMPSSSISKEHTMRKNANKSHKISCRKHASKVKSNKKIGSESKENTVLHKPCFVKLTSAEEIREKVNLANKP